MTKLNSTSTRLMNFVKAEGEVVSNLTKFSPKTLSTLSALIMFFQCFMIGFLLLINLPEAVNGK